MREAILHNGCQVNLSFSRYRLGYAIKIKVQDLKFYFQS